MFCRYLLPVILFIVVTSTANAQSNKIRSNFDSVRNADALRGLKSIDLFIQGIDDKAQHCGLTEDLVREAFAYPINQSKLQFLHYGGGPTFFIRVIVSIQRQPNQCISSLELAVMNYQRVELDYANEQPKWAWVRLWDDAWLFVAGTEPLAEQVRKAIQSSAQDFLTAWTFANKP
jgi:hypothetical protein